MQKKVLQAMFTVAVISAGCLMIGCKGPAEDAPTNTKNSQYQGDGKTSADQVGAARAKARLPHGGQSTQ
jgi:hypothetical protein